MNNADQLKEVVDAAETIVVIQAENPDGDSLASALALEQILHKLDKQSLLYCPVSIPKHLRHLSGWDRVSDELPSHFDASIIVDTSAMSLLEKALADGRREKITSKPVIVMDHHMVESDIDFETVDIMADNAVSTGELIYELCKKLNWPLDETSNNMIASSIMYDSLGLQTDLTTSRSIHIIAELVEAGVKLPALDEERRKLMKKSLEISKYKGQLLQRIEILCDGALAYVHIPWEEIEQYSDQYNPSMLVIDDMRMIEGVKIAIALKSYPDGKVTGKLRANYGYDKAAEIAQHFGGGGHPYAAGFKVKDKSVDDVKLKLIEAVNAIES